MKAGMSPHMPWLDGLRGVAALWVVLHHIHILVGARQVSVLSWGSLAVDLFMMVSGFLMAHHHLMRRDRHPWSATSTWSEFWARRWFRLSPLYYLMLVAALALGPMLGAYRDEIAHIYPGTATAAERYGDTSLTNLLVHLSYVFGAIPAYSFRTALPDWSIGLEAQFYLVFPFIMLLMARIGPIQAGLLLAAGCVALRFAFPVLMQSSFPMPSFLPLKLYVFVIGIWIAYSQTSTRRWVFIVPALLLASAHAYSERSSEAVARIVVVVTFFGLVAESKAQSLVAKLLSGRAARFMGDTSYSLYLVHLLLVIPTAALLSRHPAFNSMHWLGRFALCAMLVVPLAYLAALVLFKWVEQPGIALGRRLLQRRN